MAILKNFDMDAVRRNRARLAASGGVDLVAAITAISADIPKLKVGETVKIDVPNKETSIRSMVMSVTAKLSNLTPKGGQWEGRTFDVVSDADEGDHGCVYVQRGEDTAKPKERKRGTGGGRPAATPAPAAAATS